MKDYNTFLFENLNNISNIEKFVILNFKYKTAVNDEFADVNNQLISLLFDVIVLPFKHIDILDSKTIRNNDFLLDNIKDTPVLQLSSCPKYEDKVARLKNVYFNNVAFNISKSKKDFSQLFLKYDWLPKTVFDLNSAVDGAVGFPLVAKPSLGHSGIGIKIFKTKNELKNFKQPFKVEDENVSFDIYSKMIDIKKELRVFVMNNKVINVLERLEKDVYQENILDKDIDEPTKFLYIQQDLKKIPKEIMDNIIKIKNDIVPELNNVNFIAIDVVLDGDGKMWVLETNTTPGMKANELFEVYKEMYRKHFKKSLDKETEKYIRNNVLYKFYKIAKETYPNLLKKSEWRLNEYN